MWFGTKWRFNHSIIIFWKHFLFAYKFLVLLELPLYLTVLLIMNNFYWCWCVGQYIDEMKPRAPPHRDKREKQMPFPGFWSEKSVLFCGCVKRTDVPTFISHCCLLRSGLVPSCLHLQKYGEYGISWTSPPPWFNFWWRPWTKMYPVISYVDVVCQYDLHCNSSIVSFIKRVHGNCVYVGFLECSTILSRGWKNPYCIIMLTYNIASV